MTTRLTIDQLEKMRTHELADLLANVVLLLRRMPDVEWKQFVQQVPSDGHVTEPQPLQHTLPTSSFTEKELKKKFVPELKQIAKDLNIPFPSSIKKDDLVRKILARAAGRRSEQYAIQDI